MKKITEEIVYTEISELDYRLILYIKELREKKDWSQRDLSLKMGLTGSFVGNVETFYYRNKYNIRHLTLLTKVFKFKSVAKLFPFEVPENDWVRLTLRLTPQIKKDNTPSKLKNVEVIKVEPWVKTENKKEK